MTTSTLALVDTADALSAVSTKLDNLTGATSAVIDAVSNLTTVVEQLSSAQTATNGSLKVIHAQQQRTESTVADLAADARALAESAGTVMAKMSGGGLMGMLMGRG